MSRRVAGTYSTIALTAAIALLSALYLPSTAPAHARGRPDLIDRALGDPPARLVPGGSFTVSDRVLNRGSVPAARSWTRYYLRAGRLKLLVGKGPVRQLAPHRSAAARVVLRAPATARAGRYSLIACADARRRVRESNERNNCTAARARVTLGLITTGPGGAAGGGAAGGGGTLPPGTVDSDHDGFPDNLDCAPRDASIHPGQADAPDLKFVDSNCDGIDGDPSQAIFVATTGNDGNPGTQTRPMRSLARAIAVADAQGKQVYAAAGSYAELLEVRNQVGVYGGYTSGWTARGHSPTLITGDRLLSGSTEGAVAFDITSPTTLQLLTLAPAAPSGPGQSSYGLRGLHSSALRIDGVRATAAPGTEGSAGADGTAGHAGGNGGDATDRGRGSAGTSPAGNSGGAGGSPGDFGDAGSNGQPGLFATTDPLQRGGGLPGRGGDGGSDHAQGAAGGPGDSGVFGADASAGGRSGNDVPGLGYWLSDPGANGQPGSSGYGGGGGGAGGSDGCFSCFDIGGAGGGGGGGGQGGGGGLGGQGGGGSFGIFLVNSTGATITDSTLQAQDAGRGGRGGAGASGGAGGNRGSGAAAGGNDGSPGGDGGLGGPGARGGEGAGGAGGPSAAIAGIGPSDTHNSTLIHGNGGVGGNGGARGADGPATDYLAGL